MTFFTLDAFLKSAFRHTPCWVDWWAQGYHSLYASIIWCYNLIQDSGLSDWGLRFNAFYLVFVNWLQNYIFQAFLSIQIFWKSMLVLMRGKSTLKLSLMLLFLNHKISCLLEIRSNVHMLLELWIFNVSYMSLKNACWALCSWILGSLYLQSWFWNWSVSRSNVYIFLLERIHR